MAPELNKEELKEVFKLALKEWLDDKFTQFGKWSAYTIAAAVMGACVYFVFWVEGFKK